MFRGRYQHTVDPKGRVSVPAKYRELLSQYDEPTLIVVPNRNSLEVHPLREWERLEADINEKASMFDAEARKASLLYVSAAKEVEIDRAGRVLLPPDSRATVGLARDVTLVGAGRRYFEIWDRTRFDEFIRTNSDGGLESGFDRYTQLGVK